MPSNLSGNGDSISYSVFGWPVTTAPRDILAPGVFQESPTEQVLLQSSMCQIIPAQTLVYPATSASLPYPDHRQPNLTITSQRTTEESGGPGIDPSWVIAGFDDSSENRGFITFQLNMLLPTAVTFGIMVAPRPNSEDGASNSGYKILVNGQQVEWHQFSRGDGNRFVWRDIPIDAHYFQPGNNEIQVFGEYYDGISLEQARVSSPRVMLSAKYFWKAISQAMLGSGATTAHTQAYTVGTSKSDSQTHTFAATLGIKVGAAGGADTLLAGLSAEMSESFTTSQSTTHTLTITDSVEESTEVSFTCPPTDQSLTFQVWQLCLHYEAGGKELIQPLGIEHAPLYSRTHIQHAN